MNETEQEIVKYLKNHPHFFDRHLELLDTLQIPHQQKGTLSLVEMQLERQRAKIKELERELAVFEGLAHQNQDIFLGLMPLQQQLSHTEHFLDGVRKINDWARQYDLQQAKILLFQDHWIKTDEVPEQYWVDRKAFEIIRLERMGLKNIYLGELSGKEKSLLFLPEELPIGSLACCLLGTSSNRHHASALLLFTSRDAAQFYQGQNTAFLKHLIDIVDLHLHRWLMNREKV
ncbi:DUF484 family protein [Actinobacillus succinogenes]|uniref:DUF484 family protein n=1 Tax=Actinobacillus succinogenes (strain ATCC 55618 / DSM 22257 / CCUG 43843 / 130Z) TaxID=339671 RepID=A6VQR9_ACTSZ|nr:DUF484 domain-containing protein [Actinobacillus succinogenes]ABR75316.1 protein of unknown function DUF484 [Actinobacillus succinogenes 130Z]PHI40294.1 DUF484 family protein [Actinobacillus succinogenes]